MTRILIATHAPLDRKYGAAQTALNLAEALTKKGAEVEVWSAQPVPASVRSWDHYPYMRRALRSHIAGNRPFDVLDAPAFLIPTRLAPGLRVIARSVQPDLRYLWCDLTAGPWFRRLSPGRVTAAVFGLLWCARIISGWHRADAILCLGSDELRWMEQRFPWWRTKLGSYVSAPDVAERNALTELRRSRAAAPGRRYLWIGRWVRHKGIDTLREFILGAADRDADSSFTLAGCGSGALRAFPQALLDAGRVRVIEEFDRTRLLEMLRDHDVGLFTSIVEGWGLGLHEMLESGMTVYATPTGAAIDLAPHFENQLLPFPPKELPRAVPQEMSGRYQQDFTWDRIAADYLALASRLTGPGEK
jgi:glycosyltransferase involved in cell wall biosynthesis